LNHGGGSDEQGDALSAATRAAVDRARRRAREEVPTPDDLADMTISAARPDPSRAEIRRLAAEAIANAQQVNYLLGRLVELAGEDPDP